MKISWKGQGKMIRNSPTAIVLSIFLAIMAGCSTTHNLNKSMVGVDCQSREECATSISLPNPVNPEARFFVEPADENNRMGLAGPKYSLYLDLCVAKAIAEVYPNSHIVLGKEQPMRDAIPTIAITGLRDLRTNAFSGNLKFDGDVVVKPTV